MKKIMILLVLLLMVGLVSAAKGGKNAECTTIQNGELLASDGSTITLGYDNWGYNYQAKMFNGMYCDAYRDAAWCQDYKNDNLMIKWNDAWLSNKDCDGDGLLDRHYGFATYIGSGAWLTNHMSGEYIMDNVTCKWNYFVKIVAVPENASLNASVWYDSNDVRIGESIWGQFAIIQEVSHDSCDKNASYSMHEKMPGLGNW